jgi:hypothetical protein
MNKDNKENGSVKIIDSYLTKNDKELVLTLQNTNPESYNLGKKAVAVIKVDRISSWAEF